MPERVQRHTNDLDVRSVGARGRIGDWLGELAVLRLPEMLGLIKTDESCSFRGLEDIERSGTSWGLGYLHS